jgi:AraC-like DNA-binding protein|nr:AraC family transcriptional regulator [Kofleriaceae bacterium]
MDELADLIARRARRDGRTETALPFLTLLRESRPTAIRRGVIEPSLCAVVQGAKRLHVGTDTYDYAAPSFAMSTVEYPTSGRVIAASPRAPYLALRLALDPGEIAQVIVDADLELAPEAGVARPGVFVGATDAELTACLARLVRLLDEPAVAAYLAIGVRREIIYRLLRGPHGATIYRTIRPSSDGVRRAVDWLRRNFDRRIDIEALARTCRMSVSSLRHDFKAATALAPLQYQKQLRLQEARRLLVAGELDAGGAAHRVGYASQSQFTRDYHRLFGAPPIQHVRAARGSTLEPGVIQ